VKKLWHWVRFKGITIFLNLWFGWMNVGLCLEMIWFRNCDLVKFGESYGGRMKEVILFE
jgi:hypothetical protein